MGYLDRRLFHSFALDTFFWGGPLQLKGTGLGRQFYILWLAAGKGVYRGIGKTKEAKCAREEPRF